MRAFSTLFVISAIVLACLAMRAEASAAPAGPQVSAAQGVRGPTASPAIVKSSIKIGCKRGLASTAPGPCGSGFAMLMPATDGWPRTMSAQPDPTGTRRLDPHRAKGLLDPPRSA